MGAFENGCVTVELDKKRDLYCPLSTFREIKEKYGSLSNLDTAMRSKETYFETITWITTIMLNAAAKYKERFITGNPEEIMQQEDVEMVINLNNIQNVTAAVQAAIRKNTTGDTSIVNTKITENTETTANTENTADTKDTAELKNNEPGEMT